MDTKKTMLMLGFVLLVLLSSGSVCASLSDNLIAYWKFDNGKINEAYDFEKDEDDYITLGDNFDFLYNEEFSVSMWIRREQVSYQYPNLFSKQDRQDPYKGYNLEILSNNTIKFNYIGTTGRLEAITDDSVIPTAGVWYHIVFTYNNKVVKFYKHKKARFTVKISQLYLKYVEFVSAKGKYVMMLIRV